MPVRPHNDPEQLSVPGVATRRFETSAVQYAWLQPGVFIRRGALISGGVSYQVYAVW